MSFMFLQKQNFNPLNHNYIWQASLKPNCRDTCQIWMWHSLGYQSFHNWEKHRFNRMEEIAFVNMNPEILKEQSVT